jgi:hypothetical protein
MFTTFEPKAFPIATPTSSTPSAVSTEMLSSGSVVVIATNIKPIIVLPKPVKSATLTALSTAKSLARSRINNENRRINTLPSGPNHSNNMINLTVQLKHYRP